MKKTIFWSFVFLQLFSIACANEKSLATPTTFITEQDFSSLYKIDTAKYFGLQSKTSPQLQLIYLAEYLRHKNFHYRVFSLEGLQYQTQLDRKIKSLVEKESLTRTKKLSFREQVAKLFVVPVDGNTEPSVSTKTKLETIKPGGIILFGYNIAKTPKEVQNYLQALGDSLIFLDHEGGDVNRLRHIATPTPSASLLSASLSHDELFRFYSFIGLQLSFLGVNVNLAPVAEFLTPQNKDFLDSRVFSESPKTSGEFAKIAINAFQKAGIGAVLKHFPGTGEGDPHIETSLLDVTKDEVLSDYILPFKIANEAKPLCVLMSLVKIPAIDSKNPASFSPTIINELLRQECDFSNLVISDDLAMGAVWQEGWDTSQAVLKAIQAGCNMIMTSSFNFEEFFLMIEEAIKKNELDNSQIQNSCAKIIQAELLYGKNGILPIKRLINNFNEEEKETAFNLCKTLGNTLLAIHSL